MSPAAVSIPIPPALRGWTPTVSNIFRAVYERAKWQAVNPFRYRKAAPVEQAEPLKLERKWERMLFEAVRPRLRILSDLAAELPERPKHGQLMRAVKALEAKGLVHLDENDEGEFVICRSRAGGAMARELEVAS